MDKVRYEMLNLIDYISNSTYEILNKVEKFYIYSYVRYKLNIYLDVNYSLMMWSNCGSLEQQSS